MQESRLYSFLDPKQNFTIHFLEGQKLLHDLIITHNLNPSALGYYRDTVLTSQLMLHFLKNGENLGFYIDSEEPYFRFKIEMAHNGLMRTLLLPEKLEEMPATITGKLRITKQFPNKTPYTSIMDLKKEPASSLVNTVLKDSYQTNGQTILSDLTDQSLMITKLPKVNSKIVDEAVEDKSLSEYLKAKEKFISTLWEKNLTEIEQIVNYFEDDSFAYLGSKEVKFKCSCSKDRMIANIINLHNLNLDEIFEKDDHINVRCDYCNTNYKIMRSETEKLM